MDDDDAGHGRLLSRRAALARLSAAGFLALAGSRARAAAPASPCVARPAQTEGPFFIEPALERSDVRAGAAGVPLRLAFQLSSLAGNRCTPLAGAQVDVWQCDAAGEYSGVDARGGTGGTQRLRGWQRSDAQGLARFVSIVPGGYAGRAVHIHFKVRAADAAGRPHAFTSQLYFDDALLRRVYAQPPYAPRAARFMANSADFLYRDGGDQLLLDARADDGGYAATFPLALQWT